ncbi:nitrogen regulation protein NR(II) [Rheinheimera riviphila]|uniref:histidine kinase n=1 Tax=Rheinheimera riviphila TaxID=1834037 RepID=A0A437R0J9_9GAMM|nr:MULTISPECIES: nitrogen regulation protein NR(II) [Rheinheimera]RVU40306.1 nitrogen regulation protein NR(II) [Rheinheimera riviphila]
MTQTPKSLDLTGIDYANHLTTAIMVLDAQLQVQHFNTACCALLSIGEKRLQNHYFPALFQFSDLHASHLVSTLTTKQGFGVSDVNCVLPDGRHILIDITASALETELPALLIELRQVDQQRKISMESLQQHQHLAARELIRGLAHEIKNPLGGLRGAAQLLEETLNEEQKEYTQLIIAQADRLRNLVDRLLGPYKPPQRLVSNMHQIIERVSQLAQMDNPSGVQFVRDYDPSIPDFLLDPELIEQSLLNIVRNAQQVLPNGGQIVLQSRILHQHTIHGRRHRLVATIKVIDNGPGIPADIKDTLFYPMVSGKPGGTGLGLSIAQTLIHQHDGWIDCESWPGRTEFTLYLPINSQGA